MPDANEIKSYYDTVFFASEREWDKRGLKKSHERVVRTRQPTVLDVACGSGEWLAVCSDQVAAREVVRTIDESENIFQESGLTVEERWRGLHVLNPGWIRQGLKWMWPVRGAQALILAIWPIRWQYQIYFRCRS